MTDARSLLERHRPRLVYDSQEAYFADAASTWTDSPTNVLKRAAGTAVKPKAGLPTVKLEKDGKKGRVTEDGVLYVGDWQGHVRALDAVVDVPDARVLRKRRDLGFATGVVVREHVRRIVGKPKLPKHGERLRGERLVQLDHVDVFELEARQL